MQRIIHFHISEDDVKSFGSEIISHRLLKPQRFFLITLVIVLMAAFIVSKDLSQTSDNVPFNWSFIIFAIVALQFVAAWVFGRLNGYLIKKHYQKYGVFDAPSTLEWGERGLYYKSKIESYNCPWAILNEVAARKDCILVFTDSRKGFCIPRHVMSVEQQADFLEMAKQGKAKKNTTKNIEPKK